MENAHKENEIKNARRQPREYGALCTRPRDSELGTRDSGPFRPAVYTLPFAIPIQSASFSFIALAIFSPLTFPSAPAFPLVFPFPPPFYHHSTTRFTCNTEYATCHCRGFFSCCVVFYFYFHFYFCVSSSLLKSWA